MSQKEQTSKTTEHYRDLMEKAPLVVAFWMAAYAPDALSQDYNVTKTTDRTGPGDGSLRDAVMQSNNNFDPQDDRIIIPAGVYTLSLNGFDNSSFYGDLDINRFYGSYGTLIIEGAGSNSTFISGDSGFYDRILQICNSNSNVIIRNLTITGGIAHDDGLFSTGTARGGGILNGAAFYGGANLTLDNVILEDNSADGYGSFGGYFAYGGGLSSIGGVDVTLTNSIVRNNSALGGNGTGSSRDGKAASGGGMHVQGNLTLTGSTVEGNTAQGGDAYGGAFGGSPGYGGDADSGGIFSYGQLSITDSRITGNSVVGGIGGPGSNGSAGYNGYGGYGGARGGLARGGGLTAFAGFNDVYLTRTTVANNTVTGGSGGDGGRGGDSTNYGGTGGTGGNGGSGGYAAGGGIALFATALNLRDCTISGNTLSTGAGGNGGSGGNGANNFFSSGTGGDAGNGGSGGSGGTVYGAGIAALYALVDLQNTTVSGNSSDGGQGGNAGMGGLGGFGYFGDGSDGIEGYRGRGGNALGGGLVLYGPLYAANSTIANNDINAGDPGTGIDGGPGRGFTEVGGGVFSLSYYYSGGANAKGGPPVLLDSTIIAGNSALYAPDIGAYAVAYNSLIQDDTGLNLAPASLNNLLDVNPVLSPLADNGGPTETHAFSVTSPARNAGRNTRDLQFDQRGTGFPRVVGSAADIGALELNAAPLVASATFSPAAPFVGDAVTFTVVATDPEGGPITIVYDYGDGSAPDSTGVHTYGAAGTYTVKITVSDAEGNKVDITLQVPVAAIVIIDPIPVDPDDIDGDGFPNEVEEALGSNPSDSGSTPFNQPKPTNGGNLNVLKLIVRLNFHESNRDFVMLTGDIPKGTDPNFKRVIIDVGGVVRSFELNPKGRANLSKYEQFQFLRVRKGRTAPGTFRLKLDLGSFQSAFVDEKLTNTTTKKLKTDVKVFMTFDGKSYSRVVQPRYTARQGGAGVAVGK